jgi:hypothetical protein
MAIAAQTGLGPQPSFKSSGLAIAVNRFCKQVAAETMAQCTVQGEDALGVAKEDILTANVNGANEVTQGKVVALYCGPDIVWVEAAAAITLNDKVMTSANGRAMTATGSGAFVLGKCVVAASGAGALAGVHLDGPIHAVLP